MKHVQDNNDPKKANCTDLINRYRFKKMVENTPVITLLQYFTTPGQP